MVNLRVFQTVLFLLLTGPAVAGMAGQDAEDARRREDYFEQRIRPLLAEHCWECHSDNRAESGLRLDSRQGLLEGGTRGPAVSAERPGDSRLLKALRFEDDLEMPPQGQLAASEIAAVAKWVEWGAPWPAGATPEGRAEPRWQSHWAFQPIRKPDLPPVALRTWPGNGIDYFILARLESEGLEPSPPADRRTLLRRVTFDLTGLPPRPAETASFLADGSPDATGRVVDRLLASPRYGERWGRHWLDVARYADNKGYVFFEEKRYFWAYTYRDYVIRAFNRGTPFDRFVLEQLAADRLATGGDRRVLAAMGFLTVGGHFMNNTHDIIDDRIDVVTRGLMGLTVSCARCHDHKYDPIPQADYYALYGVFRSSREPILPPLLEPPPQDPEYREYAAKLKEHHDRLLEFVRGKHTELVTDARTRIAEYLMAAHARRGRPPADNFMLLVDKGDLNPTMILRWQRYLEDPRGTHDSIWAPWRALGDVPAESFAATARRLLAESPEAGRAESNSGRARLNAHVRSQLAANPPTSMAELADQYAALLKDVDRQWQTVLRDADQQGREPPPSLPDADLEALRQVLYGPASPADTPPVFDWGFLSLFPDRATQDEFKKLLKEVEQWSSKPIAPPRAMALIDRESPYAPRIFRRGNPSQPGDFVPRRFLRAVEPKQQPLDTGSGRLDLARAVVDPRNPLTARVLANRIWKHHFGRGLVTTPSDFGLRSEPPSHSRLLDYLAATLIEDGWSVKRLHRLILTSRTYGQSSRGVPSPARAQRIDPENRLLWRMNRRRLEFEALRDSLLDVSGRLDSTMYGPPVELFKEDAAEARRSIYGFIDRMDVSPLLTTFDFPNPAATSPARVRTTVPPQALYWMNNGFVSRAARDLLGHREMAADRSREARVRALFERLFARPAGDAEQQMARRFLGEQPDAAAWARFVHALLMTNEFAFID